eukprot:g4257.t1
MLGFGANHSAQPVTDTLATLDYFIEEAILDLEKNPSGEAEKHVYITWHLLWFLEHNEKEAGETAPAVEKEGTDTHLYSTEADFLRLATARSQSYRSFVGILRWLRWVYKYLQNECDRVPFAFRKGLLEEEHEQVARHDPPAVEYAQTIKQLRTQSKLPRPSSLSVGSSSRGGPGGSTTLPGSSSADGGRKAFHPDAPRHKILHHDDCQTERIFSRDLYHLLRIGDLPSALQLCAHKNQLWRAAGLQGMFPAGGGGTRSSSGGGAAAAGRRGGTGSGSGEDQQLYLHDHVGAQERGSANPMRLRLTDWSECYDLPEDCGNENRLLWKLAQFEIARRQSQSVGTKGRTAVRKTSEKEIGDEFESAIVGYCGGVAPCLHRVSESWLDHIWAELHAMKEHFVERWLAIHMDEQDEQAEAPEGVGRTNHRNRSKGGRAGIRQRLSGPFQGVPKEELDAAVVSEISNLLAQFENHSFLPIREEARQPFPMLQSHLLLAAWDGTMIGEALGFLSALTTEEQAREGADAFATVKRMSQQVMTRKKFHSNLACYVKEQVKPIGEVGEMTDADSGAMDLVVGPAESASGGARTHQQQLEGPATGATIGQQHERTAPKDVSFMNASRFDAGENNLLERSLMSDQGAGNVSIYDPESADVLNADYISSLAIENFEQNLDEIVERCTMLSGKAFDDRFLYLLDVGRPKMVASPAALVVAAPATGVGSSYGTNNMPFAAAYPPMNASPAASPWASGPADAGDEPEQDGVAALVQHLSESFPGTTHRLLHHLAERFPARIVPVLLKGTWRRIEKMLSRASTSTSMKTRRPSTSEEELEHVWQPDGALPSEMQTAEGHDCEYFLLVITVLWTQFLQLDQAAAFKRGLEDVQDDAELEQFAACLQDKVTLLESILAGVCDLGEGSPELQDDPELRNIMQKAKEVVETSTSGAHEEDLVGGAVDDPNPKLPGILGLAADGATIVNSDATATKNQPSTPVSRRQQQLLPPAHPLSPARPSWSVAKLKQASTTKKLRASPAHHQGAAGSSKSSVEEGAITNYATSRKSLAAIFRGFQELRNTLLQEVIAPLVTDLLALYAWKLPFRASVFLQVVLGQAEQEQLLEVQGGEEDNATEEVDDPVLISQRTGSDPLWVELLRGRGGGAWSSRGPLRGIAQSYLLGFYKDFEGFWKNGQEVFLISQKNKSRSEIMTEEDRVLLNMAEEQKAAFADTAARFFRQRTQLQPLVPLSSSANEGGEVGALWRLMRKEVAVRMLAGVVFAFRVAGATVEEVAQLERSVSESPWLLHAIGERHATLFVSAYGELRATYNKSG